MEKDGLLVEPEFDNLNKYLQSGKKTEITKEIQIASKQIPEGQTDGMTVRNILVWMNENTKRLKNTKDNRKFKRTATEILKSRERTGCCDSSTLFTVLARSKHIPTMQIVTLDKQWAKDMEKGERRGVSGHYFVGCCLQNKQGEYDWILIDADREVRDIREIEFGKLDADNRNIKRNFYAFAYVVDYSEITINGVRINSIEDMAKIQIEAYNSCNKLDFECEPNKER